MSQRILTCIQENAIVTYKKYGQTGHNKRTCKGKRASDREIPKGGNKAKKAKTTKSKKKAKTAKKGKETQVEIGQGSQAPPVTQDYMKLGMIEFFGM